MKKVFWLALIIWLLWPLASRAAVLKTVYPRLANYFLKWEISDAEARELAKWDLVVLDMEVQENSRAQLLKIRELNPKIIILAYITAQEIMDDAENSNQASLRRELSKNISAGWWLKDPSGAKISNWPSTHMLNPSDGAVPDYRGYRYNDYLPEFVVQKIKSTGLWDGIFYDNTWGDISWLNNGNLDLNNDGVRENSVEANSLWSNGFSKLLAKTRQLAGNGFIIVGNGTVYEGYQKLLNGMMLESFPSSWENGGTWAGSMKTYVRLPALNLKPETSIINASAKDQKNYRRFRFGLASALLGDGFYSFDYDISDHGQTWWYDEYNVNLGPAQSAPYNLLDSRNTEFKPGLWRRDFKYGTAIVNSTDKEQRYVFSREELDKIKGEQDPLFNSGIKINYLKLASQDGAILLKSSNVIKDSAFTNGYFFRVFNFQGTQIRNGFFSYLADFPGSGEIIIASDGENGKDKESSLSASVGQISILNNGRPTVSFRPYSAAFKNPLNLAAKITNGNFELIAAGPKQGGGPQVSLFSADGKIKGSFFAYDKKLRTGVNIALGDVDSDGQLEIITGPGQGSEPRVKIFNLKGQLKNSFLAYDKKFQGGVNLSVGDVTGDRSAEIITGAGQGGGPQVRIFNARGQALKSFMAYDPKFHGGIRVAVSDLNADGVGEILVGIQNFY